MEQAKLLIVAMVEQCRSMLQQAGTAEANLPMSLQPKHLLWMCDQIEKHAEEWPEFRLHRWIGFVQSGMVANRILDLAGAKAMFNEAKKAHGNLTDDPDLVDHLDPNRSFEIDLGGQG
jgi:hypothetical protein